MDLTNLKQHNKQYRQSFSSSHLLEQRLAALLRQIARLKAVEACHVVSEAQLGKKLLISILSFLDVRVQALFQTNENNSGSIIGPHLVGQTDDGDADGEGKRKLHLDWADIDEMVETHWTLAEGPVRHDHEVEVEAGC